MTFLTLSSLKNQAKLLKHLLTLLFTLALLPAIAQKRQNVYFYKNNDKEVSTKDSADFIRVIQEPDSGAQHFILIELYPDGTKKRVGTVSQYYPKIYLQGQALSYYKNGRKKSLINYRNNHIDGAAIYYFPNGRVHRSLEYPGLNSTQKKYGIRDEHQDMNIKLIYLADSLGHEMVVEGNGHAVEPALAKDSLISEGDFKNGFKHGLWTGKSLSGNSSYQEEYKDGAFVKGTSTVNGITRSYKSLYEMASYKGGIEMFYRDLQSIIRYPKEVKDLNIQGKVFLSFTVTKDGSLDGIKVDRSLHSDLDRVAVAAIRHSGKWIPSTRHGMPVAQKMNIPISFSLIDPIDQVDRRGRQLDY